MNINERNSIPYTMTMTVKSWLTKRMLLLCRCCDQVHCSYCAPERMIEKSYQVCLQPICQTCQVTIHQQAMTDHQPQIDPHHRFSQRSTLVVSSASMTIDEEKMCEVV